MSLAVVLIKVIASQILIRGMLREHVIHDLEHGMANSNHGNLRPTPRSKASIQGREIRILGMSSSMGRFDQKLAEPGAALAGLATETFACTLVIARAVG